MLPKILLVEDDTSLGFLLREYLEMNDYEVTWTQQGAMGLKHFNEGNYDLCILDVMVPALDGFTLAELIRNRDPHVPIVFLTAKSLHADLVQGFKSGADDYIKKPVSEDELLARIRAVLRRSAEREGELELSVFKIGKYRFDSNKRELESEGKVRRLTEREAGLLALLCRRMGELVPREYVLQKLWGKSDFLSRKSMDVFVSRLRRYLSEDENVRIDNIHSSGFVLSDSG